MSKLDELIAELCPNGVEYKPLWAVTIWDKKFNAVDKSKQKKIYNYPYLLAKDLFALDVSDGDVFLLSTGEQTGWTTVDLAGDNMREGEVVTIPWGKSRAVIDCIKYYKGKFVTADNRIMTSIDTSILSNKYLYYWTMSQGDLIDSFYRGSGIKHPDMAKVLDMKIPVPPLPVQEEIVRILDSFTQLTAELQSELQARKKQFEQYSMLLFDQLKSSNNNCVISDICSVEKGKTLIQKAVPGEYPMVVTTTERKTNGSYQFDASSVCIPLVSSRGHGVASLNHVYYQTGKFALGNILCAVTPKCPEKVYAKYLYYYFEETKDFTLVPLMKGGANVALRIDDIEKVKIPVPKIEIQKKIVSTLEKFDELCNELLPAEIESRQNQYEYYRDKLLNFKELA